MWKKKDGEIIKHVEVETDYTDLDTGVPDPKDDGFFEIKTEANGPEVTKKVPSYQLILCERGACVSLEISNKVFGTLSVGAIAAHVHDLGFVYIDTLAPLIGFESEQGYCSISW